MRAVVLVGGFGTRLRPLTLTTPKPLLPVGQRSILDHVLGHLRRHGVTEAVLSIGFNPDAFRAAHPDGLCEGVALSYAVESEPLDTAGAIRFAALHAGIDDTFIVVNGDVLTDLDVETLVDHHRRRGAEGTIHLTPVEDPSAFGVVPTEADGRVLAFIEKPPRESAPTNLINAGTYVLEPSVIERIPSGRRVSIERETFPDMVGSGVLHAMPTHDYWLDAGLPEQYLRANLDAIDGVRRFVRERAIAAGAVVSASASVDHSVLGDGVTVADGALVRDSLVMARSSIGPRAELVRSVVGVGAVIGAGARLVDTVVGNDVAVPPEAVLQAQRIPVPS